MKPNQEQMIRDIIASKRRFNLPECDSISNWLPIFDNDCSTADLLQLETLGYFDHVFYGPNTYGHTEYSLTGKAVLEFGQGDQSCK